jgi:hypothetical protein
MANPNIVHINDTASPVAAAARLEAMMTYQQRKIGHDGAEFVFLNPRIIKSKEQTFNFGRIFEITICELIAGKRNLPREVEEMFA